jgi:hypothetical protein
MNRSAATLAMLLGAWPSSAAAQGRLQIPEVATPPSLDDYLSESPSNVSSLGGLRQREPNDGDDVSQATRVYLSHDAANLYAAFVCMDVNPSAVRARLSKRDAIAQDDQVVLMLDTFHDRQRAYLFAVNPLGIQADALISEGRDDDYSFDTVWRSTGRLLPNGYAVLMAIPFKSLRIAPGAEGEWGVAVSRIIPRNSEQSFWPYVTRRVEGLIQQFAPVQRPPRAAGGRNIQLIPYLAGSTARFFDATQSTFSSPKDKRAGLDAKVVIRDAVTVDVAVNPDFSQVESDQPQVAINQRFELFYPEKRPFFIENASFFKYVRTSPTDPTTRNVPDMVFFSRRIQDPDAGGRVTGKIGRWSFGGVTARDRGLGVQAVEGGAMVNVARVQREIGSQSTIGAFLTSRSHGEEGNLVGALDVRFKLSPNWVFAGQGVMSRSKAADGRITVGPAYNASLFYSSRTVLYSLFYSDRSPSFRTTLGFVPRTDIRQIEQYGEYRWRPRSGPVVAFGPNAYTRLNWNYAGELQEWIVRFPFEVHLKGRTQVFVRRVESSERFNGVDLRQKFQTINVTTEWLKWLSINEGYEWGRQPNYFPPAGIAPSVGVSTSAMLGLTFRPTPRLRYEQTYLYSGLDARGGASRQDDIFRNHIARSSVNYQFTRELSIRAIADYNAVLPNPRRVRLVNDERVGIDTLVTYQVGPGTAVYFGYTTGLQNLQPVEGSPAIRVQDPTTVVGRQLFLKMSYLFRR